MSTDYLSYSRINCFLTCPLKYRFCYVDEIAPEFTPASLAFGSAIHEAAAAYFQSRLEAEPLKPDQMVHVYREAWESREVDVRFFNGDNAATLEDKARKMLSVFHESQDPTARILGVEEFFAVNLGKGIPPLHGYIDLIEQSGDGRITIVDLKTAAKKPTDFQVHNNLQLTAYSIGATALGFSTDDLSFRLDVVLKTKNPELVRMETIRTDRNRRRFMRVVHEVWKGIHQGIAFPKDDWHCVQCAYAQACKDL
ncbi:MAG: PD-(D/E)XK nuclease family protein [Thermodesulfobacteriota bacterium]